MKAYLDSSFLFLLYFPDPRSASAISVAKKYREALAISSLTEVEFVNALELRVFRHELSRSEADGLRGQFEGDVERGVYTVSELDSSVMLRARDVIVHVNAKIGCRTADVLHVAAALEGGAGVFLTFDERQKALARRVKLTTN